MVPLQHYRPHAIGQSRRTKKVYRTAVLLLDVYSLRKYSPYQDFLAGGGIEVVGSGGWCSLGKKSLYLWVQILLTTPTVQRIPNVVTALPVCEKAVELALLHAVNVVLVT